MGLIEQIKQKPMHQRKKLALFITLAVALVLAVILFFELKRQFTKRSDTEPSQSWSKLRQLKAGVVDTITNY